MVSIYVLILMVLAVAVIEWLLLKGTTAQKIHSLQSDLQVSTANLQSTAKTLSELKQTTESQSVELKECRKNEVNLQITHNQALTALQESHTKTLTEALDSHNKELFALNKAHNSAVTIMQETHAKELFISEQRHNAELSEAKKTHNIALTTAQETHAKELFASEQRHNTELSEAKKAHNIALTTAMETHTKELFASEQRHYAELSEAKKAHNIVLNTAQETHSKELFASEQRHNMEMTEAKKAHNIALTTALEAHNAEMTAIKQRNSELETLLDAQATKFTEQIELLTQAKEQMKQEFENLAQKIFEEKGKTFSEQNKTNLDLILNPFRAQITEFKSKVEEVYVKEGQERFSLTQQIDKMHLAYESLSQEANNLVKALKADTKTQGDWGEINLRRILDFTGLKEGLHYFAQPNYQTEDGENFRPDIVVDLPDNRQIIVDSKVSLTGYERYFNASNEADKEQGIKDHLKSVRKHIQELADKKYEDLKGINTLDFVLMFIPVEAAYFVALDNDTELYQIASSRKVLLVCPSTLLITLQLVHSLWRIDTQSKNVIKIADQGAKLYDKFVGFVDNFMDIKANLDKTMRAYDAAYGQLIDGNGNLISQAEKLKTLGVKTKKHLPEKLLTIAQDIEPEQVDAIEDADL